MTKKELELLNDILTDLVYYNLEMGAKKDELNPKGLATLVELRHDPMMHRVCRKERFEQLSKLVEKYEMEVGE